MPTMTASTITFTPEATMLPSTFSARNAVLLKSAKGMRMKPASVVHRQDEEGDQHQDPRDHQHRDLDEVREEAGEAHHLVGRVEQRLTGVEPDLGQLARPQEVGGGD